MKSTAAYYLVLLPKRACVLFSSLLLYTLAFSQNAAKGFYVVNNESKIPVAEAFVQNADGNFQATADGNGYVNLTALPDSVDSLVVSHIGYASKQIAVHELTTPPPIIYLDTKISSLEEVTVLAASGTNIFKPISDLDIHLRPVNNSQDVLRIVPGLFIGQHAGGGKAEQLFLRGFDVDHGTDVNISVDGMPVNMVSHAHGQGYADLHFVIPEFIDRVNFNKGPYYADKGNFTTAGYVEFKLKDYLEKDFIKVEGGQFSTLRGVAGVNLLKPKKDRREQSLYVGGEASFTQGYFDNP